MTSNLEQNAPGLALVMMEGTSYIEHNYVAPFQGFRLLGGGISNPRVAHTGSVLTLG